MSLSVSRNRIRHRYGSHLVLAIALAAGSAVIATGFADPAHAMQRKKDNRKKKEENGASYSQEFIAAYSPIDEAMKAEGPDLTAIKAMVPAMKNPRPRYEIFGGRSVSEG